MRLRLSALLSLAGAMALVGACGDSTSPAGPVYQIELPQPTLELGQDSTYKILATIRNVTEDRVLASPPLTYRSLDWSIATVDTTGKVTAIKGGATDIQVIFRDDTLDLPVTVRPNPLASFTARVSSTVSSGTNVSISAGRDSLTLGSGIGPTRSSSGQVFDIAARGIDGDGDVVACLECTDIAGTDAARIVSSSVRRRLSFTSTDTKVATVNSDTSSSTYGRVTARDTGTTMIVVTVPGDDAVADTIHLKVTLRHLIGVLVRPADSQAPNAIKRDRTLQREAIPLITSSTAAWERRVVWSSMDTTKAKVDQLGLVTARSNASTTAPNNTVVIKATAIAIPEAGVPAREGTITLTIMP